MNRYRFLLWALGLAVLFGLAAPLVAGVAGPAWLGYPGLGWTVARSAIAAPVVVALALLVTLKTRRSS